MLYLRTGLPGASKTLNTLKEIVSTPTFYKREIYYNNIKLLFFDLDVCQSFSGWFYGVYLTTLEDSKEKKYKHRLKEIHELDRHADLDDFPYLEQLYDSWLTRNGPMRLWLYWIRRCYPKDRLTDLNNYLDLNESPTIEELRTFKLDWRSFDTPTLWYELPRGSVIIIDECQQWFPNRRVGSPVPRHASEFETHRHKGYDVHLITQDAKLFDVHVRRLSGRHIHYSNPFGSGRVTRLESEKVFDPTDYHQKQSTTRKILKRDSNFYGLYWSADIHTHKFKFPKKLLVIPLLFVLAAVLVYLLLGGHILGSPSNDDLHDRSSISNYDASSLPGNGFLSSDDYTVLPIQNHRQYNHPLATVCESISLDGVVTTYTKRGFQVDYLLFCNIGDITYVPSQSDEPGFWDDNYSGFRLTSNYLDSYGYNFIVADDVPYLVFRELRFVLSAIF